MVAGRSDISRNVDQHGRVVFDGKDAIELLLRGVDITSLAITATDETVRYNQHCASHDKSAYQVGDNAPLVPLEARRATWFLSEPYQQMDVRQELLARCRTSQQIERVNRELDLFEERGLLPVLRLMFYLVDQFRENGIVWGVGRGSSVASYCLYLIGVHRIDSLRYDLPIEEFLK